MLRLDFRKLISEFPEGPYVQPVVFTGSKYSKFEDSDAKSRERYGFGTRDLKYWVLGASSVEDSAPNGHGTMLCRGRMQSTITFRSWLMSLCQKPIASFPSLWLQTAESRSYSILVRLLYMFGNLGSWACRNTRYAEALEAWHTTRPSNMIWPGYVPDHERLIHTPFNPPRERSHTGASATKTAFRGAPCHDCTGTM